LKYAYLYAKTVTLGKTHWPESNRVLLRNRRIGCSMSGIAQFIAKKSLSELREWSLQGYDTIQEYDKKYSDWLAIPRSIKTTCIKPSGTVSLLAGATPGMHYPTSEYYIRRVRLPIDSDLVKPLMDAGYSVHPAAEAPEFTVVAEFPIHVGERIKKANDVSMWEQLGLAAFLQEYWADNQVSSTVTFDPSKEGHQLKAALDIFQYKLKGISFLPLSPNIYKDLPYEEIDSTKYQELSSKIKTIDWSKTKQSMEPTPDKFCNGEQCNVQLSL